MPTLLTDPRSGGVKKSSGVNVNVLVRETWEEVRDDNNPINWLIATYDGLSKTDVTVFNKGPGGIEACAKSLPPSIPVFGGLRLNDSGKFVSFFYADQDTSVMKKGRASMHKNGVLNVLEGCVSEIDIRPGMTEDDLLGLHVPSSSIVESDQNQSKKLSTTTAFKVETVHINETKNHDTMTDKTMNRSKETSTETNATVPLKLSTVIQDDTKNSIKKSKSTAIHSSCCIPYDELKKLSIDNLPSEVDPLHREKSLSDDDFFEVFEMNKESFYSLPVWKQTSKKKAKFLF